MCQGNSKDHEKTYYEGYQVLRLRVESTSEVEAIWDIVTRDQISLLRNALDDGK